MRKMKIQLETVSQQLKTRKKSILIWLRSGFSFYYLKFFGLWKPETKMGTIADHFKLQQEQLSHFSEFYNSSQQNQTSKNRKSGSAAAEESAEEKLQPSDIKAELLQRVTADTILDCVDEYMKAHEQEYLFDPSKHKQYDAKFYHQRGDASQPMTDAPRSEDATRAYQDLCTSLRLVGLLPQMKKENIKYCVADATKERKEVEQKNAENSAWWRLQLDLRAERKLRPFIRRQTSDFLRNPILGQWSTLALVCYIYSILMYGFTLYVQVDAVLSYPRNVVYLVSSPVWSANQANMTTATTATTATHGEWTHYQMLALALAIKESFCLTPFVILACIYVFFSFLGAMIYPLVQRSESLRSAISATVEVRFDWIVCFLVAKETRQVVALEIWTNFVMLRNMSTMYRIYKIVRQLFYRICMYVTCHGNEIIRKFFRGHINWSIEDFYFKITNLANICFNVMIVLLQSRDRDFVSAGISLQNSLSSSVIVSLALSIFMLLRLFCAENVVLEKIKCTMCDLNENRLSKLEVALTMSKLIEVFTEMDVDFNFVGHFYSNERLLPILEEDMDASTHSSSEIQTCVMKYPGYGYDNKRNECYNKKKEGALDKNLNAANEKDGPPSVDIQPGIENEEQRHPVSRTNQPKAESLATLQESPTATAFHNGEALTSSVQLGLLIPTNENCAQGHEINWQGGQHVICADLSSYLPGVSGEPWPGLQPYPIISPGFE